MKKQSDIAPGATQEERGIIDGFFSGKSIEELAREYAATHITENRTNMKVSEARQIIAAALLKIKYPED